MQKSIWLKDYKNNDLPKIEQEITTPILIIGGGIAGLMCAYYLMKEGKDFLLIDGRKLGCGVSAGTTAQLSIAHGKKYLDLLKKHGKDKTIQYLKSQQHGLSLIKKVIEEEKIKCDYQLESTILCANSEKEIADLEQYYELMKEAGVDCKKINDSNDILNYEVGIEFKEQGIFNPMKYIMAIVNILIKQEVALYEDSRATKIKKSDDYYQVTINEEHVITAKQIIMACGYPQINPDNLYFAKVFQSTSYAVAFKTKLKLSANYVYFDKPYYYFRTYDKDTLIIGGNDHYTGSNSDPASCYEGLRNKAYELDTSAEVINQWFAEDVTSIDSLPFIDNYSRFHPNIILVTGFGKWGFTNSHMAAQIVKDMILGKEENELYKTDRFVFLRDLKSSGRMVLHSLEGLLLSKLKVKEADLENLKIGSGEVMKLGGKNALVYRHNKQEYVILKNKCTHMGCALMWNDPDQVWACKCHGSIFDKCGKVLYGPAKKDLEEIDVDK